jgi:hypothetical protein
MRLLIAEDDKALGQFLSRGLEADGHRVHLAYDGGAAVEAFRQELPDLTILDLNMPVKDGEQVLEEVRICALGGSGAHRSVQGGRRPGAGPRAARTRSDSRVSYARRARACPLCRWSAQPCRAGRRVVSDGCVATFAALDAGTSVGTPNWIHAGGRQAEAGFQDPALGWVGVRADLSGGTVHAALVPGSTEAAQALSGHLAGLNAYLAEQQTPVATLTMAAPGTSGMETGVDQSMQQSAGQHGKQNPAAAQQTGAQPGASSSATAVSATTTNAGFDAIAYVGGSRGTHISVMA